MIMNKIIPTLLFIILLLSAAGCGGTAKPQVPAHAVKKKEQIGATVKVDEKLTKKTVLAETKSARKTPKQQTAAVPKTTTGNSVKEQTAAVPKTTTGNSVKEQTVATAKATTKEKTTSKKTDPLKDNPYSNSIRVKTIYELAAETKPILFLNHDEFETADEYKVRVSEQVKLMKEIVMMTSQKMDIKKAQRIQVAKEKEFRSKTIIENIMAESASPVEFTPEDIGRYNPEQETFPVILHQTQYQISVPREEARTFKANFKSVKIKGVKQLKPKYDVKITVSKAHIRSRPNGSIVGIANGEDLLEHVNNEDEWYKINYKGQFAFTHQNNAELKLVDFADDFDYLDLVAIHPTTGSMFAMISVDKLVKAPLNLASRKLVESGQADGPK